MSDFDQFDPAVLCTPTHKDLVRVVRGLKLDERIFMLTVRNKRPHPVVPVFIPSQPFLAVGPPGVGVEPVPTFLEDGREQWRASSPIEPGGEWDYDVLLDTLQDQFPPAGSRFYQITLDVFVEEQGYLTPAVNIPVVLREILDSIPEFTGVVALDFGTTNTSAVVSPRDHYKPQVVTMEQSALGGGEEIPSLIAYLDVGDSKAPMYTIGQEAKQLLGQPGGDGVISSVKRYVPVKKKFLVGGARDGTPVYYAAPMIASHIVSNVRSRIERDLKQQAVVEMTVTYPTSYSKSQIDSLRAVFDHVQSDVAERYGEEILPVRMLLDEATAAAIFYLTHRFGNLNDLREHIAADEFSVLCYDLGGGTTDLSLTRFAFQKGVQQNPAAEPPVSTKQDSGLTLLDVSSAYGTAEYERAAQDRNRAFVYGKIAQRDGLTTFGGDNMTLSVFRMLKIRYALLLAEMVLSDDLESMTHEDVLEVRDAAETIANNRKLLERWCRRGDPQPRDDGVGYAGYAGVPMPEEIWEAADVLVPTRHHEGYRHSGREADKRRAIFADMWQTAESAKIAFGTAGANGEFPSVSEPIPPGRLLDRYEIAAARLPVRITAAELRAHVEPSLLLSFAKAKSMLREESLLSADFFVLAGNACKLPLVRELFATQFAAFGAVDGWNILFDPAVAKTAVARGAALYAVHTSAGAGTTWSLEKEDALIHDHIGVLESQSVFASASEPMQVWFKRGTSYPAHTRVRLRKELPSLRIYATRRMGSPPNLIGAFMFLRDTGRVSWHNLESDLEDAVNELTLDHGGVIGEDGTYMADIVITRRQRIFLQRDRMWFALWTTPVGLPDHLNPFSGRQ